MVNSKAKGNSFENKVCTALSLWVSQGDRSDLFMRNILSGGRFTNINRKAGAREAGLPGDIMAADPLAFDLLSLFAIECKHHKDIQIGNFLFDPKGTSFLAKVYAKTKEQSDLTDSQALIIAKSNQRPAVCLTAGYVGKIARECAIFPGGFTLHYLHNGAMSMFTFDALVNLVPSDVFLGAIKDRLEC